MKKIAKIIIEKVKQVPLSDRYLIIFMFLSLVQITISMFDTSQTNPFADSIDVVLRTSIASVFGYFISANFIREKPSLNRNLDTSSSTLNPANDDNRIDGTSRLFYKKNDAINDLAPLGKHKRIWAMHKLSNSNTAISHKQEIIKQQSTQINNDLQSQIDPNYIEFEPQPLQVNSVPLTQNSNKTKTIQRLQQQNIANTKILKEKTSNTTPFAPQQNTQLVHLQTIIIGSICLSVLIIMFVARKFATLNTSNIPTLSQFRDVICGSLGFLLGIPHSSDTKNK